MPFHLHPRISTLIAAGAGPSGSPGFAGLRRGDPAGLRAVLDHGLAQMSALPPTPGVTARTYRITAEDGTPLRLRWYTRDGATPGSAVVHLHGGGMIAGSADLYEPLVRTYVAWTGVPFLAVDYRLAPGAAVGVPAGDAFAGLRWARANAGDLGIDPARIAVMGDSAGGGVAAATAILARNAGIPIARQILIYPMLDDRNLIPNRHLTAEPTIFSYDFNFTAWRAVLGDIHGTDAVPAIAAPARNTDFADLAPAYIEVGELDIFRDEDVDYARRLWAAGVSTELHVHPGLPHAFDVLLIGDEAGERHKTERVRVLHDL
ncbi:alpha/beta hydrolase [Actinoplanes rectilineatus]|uniref:alpha/beta hydrolase n=1 Tax=Actinoplanes rectilineatus TaxID=113571 RepID=UPI0005F2CB13|nr:alpha/beta hydrolase [Actinoplanes rectilineatus]